MKNVLLTFFITLVASSLFAQVTASFLTETPGDSCGSRSVRFDAASSTGIIDNYQWQFTDLSNGNSLGTGAGNLTLKNFLQSGKYLVSLTVSGPSGTDVSYDTINVYSLPEIMFNVDVHEGCPPLQVTFSDNSLPGNGTITQWEWNYNDGTKDVLTTNASPTHNYTSSGVYTPTLIVTNSFGCTKSLPQDSLVVIYPEVNPSFLVRNNYNCTVPHEIEVENTSDLNGPYNFTWDFGDGTTLSNQDTFNTHTYNEVGVYRIRLTGSNLPGNCSNTASSSGPFNVYIGAPVAQFSTNDTICLGTRLYFTPGSDSTGLTNDGRWFFEDTQNFNNGRNVYHTFNQEGTWEVKYLAFNTYSGCQSDTARQMITVLPTPTASLAVDDERICKRSDTVTFQNLSSNASSFTWNFGDGSTLTTDADTAVSHIYANYGNFTVTLTATNAAGCSNQTVYRYIRNQPPTVDFEINPLEGCAPVNAQIMVTASANDPISSYIYTYSDGTADTVSSPNHSHTFTQSGTQSIAVAVQTATGCQASAPAKNLNVIDICIDDGSGGGGGGGDGGGGALGVSRGNDCSTKYTLTFEDTLKTVPVYSWDFDGTEVISTQNPITYTFPDNIGKKQFLVTVKLKDPATTEDTIIRRIMAAVVDEKADYDIDVTDICKGLPVSFTTIGIDSSNIATYIWDFGDSTARQVIDNATHFTNHFQYLNGNTTHNYLDTGVFVTKLIVIDKFGCADSIEYPTPVTVKGPKAYFTVDTNSVCSNQFNVSFQDSSTANGATPITNWEWTMGDGTTLSSDSSATFSHNYNHTSYYRLFEPTLEITDSLGCSDSYTLPVRSYAPRAQFYTRDTLRCGKFDIFFYNQSSAQISDNNRFTWKYSDGSSQNGYYGNHTFPDTGHYAITLIVEDDGGCKDSTTYSDYVKLVKPIASFAIGSDTSKCVGTFSLPFTSTSLFSSNFSWDFGDGEMSQTTQVEVSHFYEIAGTYEVQLAVIGLDGCRDTITQEVTIKGPSGELVIDDTYLCLGDSLEAHVNGSNIEDYYWDFDDLSSTTSLVNEDSVAHLYNNPGGYLPNLILLSPDGCQITLRSLDTVKVDQLTPGPTANIECGDSTTEISATTYLNTPNNYFWTGPGPRYPDSLNLTVDVTTVGFYTLHVVDEQCDDTVQVEVTSSGNVPTADAGADQLIDCITRKAYLSGSTTTADTSFHWSGPLELTDTTVVESSIYEPTIPGNYVLTVTQKECTTTDTVLVTDCGLDPIDTSFSICANNGILPSNYRGYDLTIWNDVVDGNVLGSITWYLDSLFLAPVHSIQNDTVVDNGVRYAQIISLNGIEMARAQVDITVFDYVEVSLDTLPPSCAGEDTLLFPQGLPIGGFYTGVGVNPVGQFISPLTADDYTITYEYTSPDGCRDTIAKTTRVFPIPNSPIHLDTLKFCQDISPLPELSTLPDINHTLFWYSFDTTSTPSLTAPSLSRISGLYQYYVHQQNELCYSPFKQITVVVDTTPSAPIVEPLAPICEGDTIQLHGESLTHTLFDWTINTASSSEVARDSTHLTLASGSDSIRGVLQTTTTEGCVSPPTNFIVPVHLMPTPALVFGEQSDTVNYCLATTEHQIEGNEPVIGIGQWLILQNHSGVNFHPDLAISELQGFDSMNDTLLVQWSIRNGVCPTSYADLTVFPEPYSIPEVALGVQPDTLCEGTSIELQAIPGDSIGDSPLFQLLSADHTPISSPQSDLTFNLNLTNDTLVYVKIFSDYFCTLPDTGISELVEIKTIPIPEVTLVASSDTACETDGPITISTTEENWGTWQFQWSRNGELIASGDERLSFDISTPNESDYYTFIGSNPYCASFIDSIPAAIIEQPYPYFNPDERIIVYSSGATLLLDLQHGLVDSTAITGIDWSDQNLLTSLNGNSFWSSTDIYHNVLYQAQNFETELTIEATVYTGPMNKGCEATAYVDITNFIPVEIPNAFSPNGDGLNDTWRITGLARYPTTEVHIYDRWGSEVFHARDGYDTPWNGEFKGQKLTTGTYYYVAVFKGSPDHADFETKGWIVLLE